MNYKLWFFLLCTFLLLGCHRSEHRYQGYVETDTIFLAQPFAGYVKHRYVYRGQNVKKNQLLFVIDPEPESYQLAHAKSALDQGEEILNDLQSPKRPPEIAAIKAQIQAVEAEIKLASLRLKRNQTLFNKRVIAPDTLDAAQTQVDEKLALKKQLEANLDLALLGARENLIEAQMQANKALKANVEQAQWSVQQKNILAPVDGFVFDVFYREGEFVSAGAPVAALLAPSDIYLEFFVPLYDLHDLQLGKNITYHYLKQDKIFHAKVVYVSPKAEYMPPLVYSNENADKLVFRVKARVLEKNEIFPGEPVTVHVESNHA